MDNDYHYTSTSISGVRLYHGSRNQGLATLDWSVIDVDCPTPLRSSTQMRRYLCREHTLILMAVSTSGKKFWMCKVCGYKTDYNPNKEDNKLKPISQSDSSVNQTQ